METIFKIDLDVVTEKKAIMILKERIFFLNQVKILPKKFITRIELVKKKKYSARLYFRKRPVDEIQIILVQAMLGDDWKRLAITYRDFRLGLRNWNRLFDIKKYPDGEYLYSKRIDVTRKVLYEK